MAAVRISTELHEKLVAHALDDAPNECCGLIEFEPSSNTVVSVLPMENVAASPMRFELGSKDLLEIPQIEERGYLPVIYHSHTRSAPEPSQTDITFAELWPGVPWAIVGVAGPRPEVRWFEINGGRVDERPIDRITT
jgi:proteasome lid subunit RPN8/RPN11